MTIHNIFNRRPYNSEADNTWDDSLPEPVTSTSATQPSRNAVVKPFTHERLPLDVRLVEVKNRLEAFEKSIKVIQQQYS